MYAVHPGNAELASYSYPEGAGENEAASKARLLKVPKEEKFAVIDLSPFIVTVTGFALLVSSPLQWLN